MPSSTRPKRLQRGDPISAGWLRQITDALVQRMTVVGGGRVNRIGTSISIEIDRARSSAVSVVRFIVKSIDGDFITARKLIDDGAGGTTEGDTDVLIAKPWMLRRTPFDGETRNGITYTYSSDTEREADDGAGTEDQIMVPSYQPDDEIYATSSVSGGTGVFNESEPPVAITWLDLNLDAREWSKKKTT